MRASWEALHASLVRSVRTRQSALAFQQAKQQHSALARFDDAGNIVSFLVSKFSDAEERNRVFGSLASMVQRREHFRLASTLLWLGLWPGSTLSIGAAFGTSRASLKSW